MLGYINNKLIIIKRHFSFRSKSTNRLEAAAAAVRPESLRRAVAANVQYYLHEQHLPDPPQSLFPGEATDSAAS